MRYTPSTPPDKADPVALSRWLRAEFQRVANAMVAQETVAVLADGVKVPDAAPGIASIYIDSADGDLKIKFSDGTVKTIVIDT